MAKDFRVNSNGVVTQNHSAIQCTTKIRLSGNTDFSIHAYFDGTDNCTNLVGSGNCPLPSKTDLLVQCGANTGHWQLGTDSSNDGGDLQSRQGGPLTSNGTLTVGTPTPDDDDESGGRGQGGGRG